LKHDLAAVSAAHPGKTVRLWAQDESRFGLHTVLRRRLTLPGLKPICPFEQLFESFWLCGAIEPNSGESFVLELPATDSDCLQAFLDRFAATHAQDPGEVHVLLMDRGGAHRAKALCWPERVVPVYLPAYCPELNPMERWWRELKDAVANTLFGALAPLRACLEAELHAWSQGPERLCSLTSYPYIIDALCSLG
jgi:transposase